MFANVFGIIGYILLLTVKHNGKFNYLLRKLF